MFSNHEWIIIIFSAGGVVSVIAWLKIMVQKTIDRVDKMSTTIVEVNGAIKDLQKTVNRIENTVTADRVTIVQLIKDVQRTESDVDWIKKNMEKKGKE